MSLTRRAATTYRERPGDREDDRCRRPFPCLWFDGQAEQAAAHYTAIIPDSEILGVTCYGPGVPGTEGSVLTVSFSFDGQEYVGLNAGAAEASERRTSVEAAPPFECLAGRRGPWRRSRSGTVGLDSPLNQGEQEPLVVRVTYLE